jgi:hydrogenase maturation factor
VEPTVVVKRRERRVAVTDEGSAVALAGAPPGWRKVARRIELDYVVNVTRNGTVWLPVQGRFNVEEIEERIARASLALYQDLLELQNGVTGAARARRTSPAPRRRRRR